MPFQRLCASDSGVCALRASGRGPRKGWAGGCQNLVLVSTNLLPSHPPPPGGCQLPRKCMPELIEYQDAAFSGSYEALDSASSAWGIAPGETIGIRDYSVSLPSFPVGTGVFGSGGGFGATYGQGAGLPSILGAAADWGVFVSEAARSQTAIEVDPYPGYEGEVTPETHPDLYLPPDDPQIPSPEERYEAALPQILIPTDANEDPYEPDPPGGGDTVPTFSDILLGGLNSAIDIAQGQAPAPTIAPVPVGFAPTITPALPAGARPVQIDPRTGKPVCRRRRRRRLLTDSDFNDLMRISTLPGNQNVRLALAKAVGRRS